MAQPNDPITDKNLAHQTGKQHGKIKQPQQTYATMVEKDLPRGSEKETHARK